VPHLRRIVEIGRTYLKNPTVTFWEEQKGILWHQHKHGLDCWHGPFTDPEGRSYFVNTVEEVSSWQDPRVDAQYLFELENGLLCSLERVLPRSEEADPWLAENGAEVLSLDSPSPQSALMSMMSGGGGGGGEDTSPTGSFRTTFTGTSRARLTNGWRRGGAAPVGATGDDIKNIAIQTAKREHVSKLEEMGSQAKQAQSIQQDEEEAQRLALTRKVEERKMRRQEQLLLQRMGSGAVPSASAPTIPPPPQLPSQVFSRSDVGSPTSAATQTEDREGAAEAKANGERHHPQVSAVLGGKKNAQENQHEEKNQCAPSKVGLDPIDQEDEGVAVTATLN